MSQTSSESDIQGGGREGDSKYSLVFFSAFFGQ